MTTTLVLDHHGRHLTGTSEEIAREILRENGKAHPHPWLLEDTVREVEYHAHPAPEPEPEQADEPTVVVTDGDDTWSVVKDAYEVPCEHPACDTVHRHLYNASYDHRTLVTLYNMKGEEIGSRWETRYHVKTVHQWLVLLNDQRVGDVHSTKREAVADARRMPRI